MEMVSEDSHLSFCLPVKLILFMYVSKDLDEVCSKTLFRDSVQN